MISEERMKELKEYFWNDNNEETESWIDNLTEEEAELINQWDNGYGNDFNVI